MVFGDEAEEARVGDIDGVAGCYPTIVFGETESFDGCTVDDQCVSLECGVAAFVQVDGVAAGMERG